MRVCFDLESCDREAVTGPSGDIGSSSADLSSLALGSFQGRDGGTRAAMSYSLLDREAVAVLTGARCFPHVPHTVRADP